MTHSKIPKIPERRYFFSNKVNNPDGAYTTEDITPCFPTQANLVSSLTQEQPVGFTIGDQQSLHAPVLDFDFPIEVLPSTQLGHYHLYIHKQVPWAKYKLLLGSLKQCELIEPGYANASMAKGFTAVRPVGVHKPNPPRGSAVLMENARLRRENFLLNQRILELEAQVNNEPKQAYPYQAAAKATTQV